MSAVHMFRRLIAGDSRAASLDVTGPVTDGLGADPELAASENRRSSSSWAPASPWSRVLATAPVLLGVLLLAAAPSAYGAEGRAGWELSATNFPTNLVPADNEVQLVTPEEGSASFRLFFQGEATSSLPAGSSPSAVEEALEAIPSIGAGNVTVSAAGQSPGAYEVEFVGLLKDEFVRPLGGEGATALIKTRGSASGVIEIRVINVGGAASNGTVTVTDTLPSGLRAKEAGELRQPGDESGTGFGVRPEITHELWSCTGNGPGSAPSVSGATVVTCTNNPQNLPRIEGGGGLPETFLPSLDPPIGISVEAAPGARDQVNRAAIAGGGALTPASTQDLVRTQSESQAAGLTHWDTWFSNADGTIDTQAGSHPYEMTTVFDLATLRNAAGEGELSNGEARDLEVKLPAGFVGNLRTVPQCTRAQLLGGEFPLCPSATQIGTLDAGTLHNLTIVSPIYNVVPRPGAPAEFGFRFAGVNVFISFSVASGDDDALIAHIDNLAQRQAMNGLVTIWGVPGEKSHDAWRGPQGCTPEQEEESPISGNEESFCSAPQHPFLTPLLTLPTACGEPQLSLIRVLSGWQLPDATSEATALSHDSSGSPVGFSGCEKLSFDPSLAIVPSSAQADTPSGLTADVAPTLGGLEERGALGTSDIRDATVTLPPGLTINPGQAAGLQACSPAQSGLTTAAERAAGQENDGPAACPAGSQIGTVQIKSPLLEGAAEKQLEGNIYVLESNPPEVKLLLAASADGVNVKIPGVVKLNQQTGQIESTFADTPQLPFSDLKLSFNGGAQAALVTPKRCDTYEATSDFTPWASPSIPDAFPTAKFSISAGPSGASCPGSGALPFSPTMAAGTTNAAAGSSSSFVLRVSKPDDQQNIKSIEAVLPPGQLAKLAGVPLCPESDTASGNCPSGSQVGSVSAEVGPGSNPLQVPQPGKAPTAAYLAGPYKGAPYSLVIKVPAQAGPFDLGTVAVRTALDINETTTQVTAKSDPLPQILDGVPLEYRSVTVNINKPGFIQNPTNCEPMKVTGNVAGSEGGNAAVSTRYQVGDCASLAFKPKLALKLKGGTKRHTFPALRATLTYPKQGAYANIKKAQVTLPHSEFLEQGHIGTVCTRVQFAAKACPAASIYGHATAISPLLNKPVSGPVYLRSSSNKLPDLVAALSGEIDVALDGKIDTGKGGGIRNTFQAVPDAPVSKFTLELKGGKKGLLVNSENICSKPQHATADFTGQNGKIYNTSPLISNSCAKKAKGKK